MRFMKFCLPAAALLLGSLTPALAATSAEEAVETLHTLFDAEWERGLRENPTFATYLGDERYNDQWPDVSLATIQRQHKANQAVLKKLAAINRDALPADEQLNYDLFQREYEETVEGFGFRSYLIPLNQRGGIQTANELTEVMNFTDVDDYQDWIARMEKLNTYMDQTIALMREGVKTGIVPPKVIMERIPDQIRAQIVAKPEDSPFYAPFKEFPDNISAAERERLRNAAKNVIRTGVVPVYETFLAFFNKEYLPASRDTVGAWALPDGREFYEYRTRSYTTTELTPEQIHEIGLQEVARIRGEMDKVIEEVGFEGDFQAFLEFLRTDPQFYFDNQDDLYREYLAISKRLDPELVKLFGKLPRMPYGVRPIPDAIAPDTTTAYYQPPAADGSRAGYYYVNLYKPEVRPKYEMEVLSVHEAVPGHHLQISLAMELGELPNFRRYGGFTAFVEGWGLYSERLGYAMGLYQDPYSRFGQLTYDMWRAVRLVVDTGIHYKGWTRQQAIDFFKGNAAKTEHDIVNEIDRYIAWPGQALAYKIGQLRILELREKAEQALGDKFDIKGFHDTVLGSGALPLDILERKVNAWIAEQQNKK